MNIDEATIEELEHQVTRLERKLAYETGEALIETFEDLDRVRVRLTTLRVDKLMKIKEEQGAPAAQHEFIQMIGGILKR